jgi:hypothetical protein
MQPDPTAPVQQLPVTMAFDSADLVAQIAPYAFGLLVAVLMVGFTWRLIRSMR